MTLIICAIKPEAKPFLNALENVKTEKCKSLKVNHGTISGIKVTVIRCGVGLKKAAAATQAMIDGFPVTKIVMSGTAGGVDSRLKIGDTVVSEEILYHEKNNRIPEHNHSFDEDDPFKADENLLLSAKKATENELSAGKVYFGRITSGNKFATGKLFKTIAEKYHPLCVDMETAAVANVCAINSIPFIAVRSITDTPEKSGIRNFYKNVKLASNNSFRVVEKLLKHGQISESDI